MEDRPSRNADSALEAQTVEGLRIALGVTPGVVGTNEIEVRLAERDGAPVEGARVLTLLGPGLAPDQVTAHDLREGLYHVPAPPLTVAGPWSFAVEVQRANAFDAGAPSSSVSG